MEDPKACMAVSPPPPPKFFLFQPFTTVIDWCGKLTRPWPGINRPFLPYMYSNGNRPLISYCPAARSGRRPHGAVLFQSSASAPFFPTKNDISSVELIALAGSCLFRTVLDPIASIGTARTCQTCRLTRASDWFHLSLKTQTQGHFLTLIIV